MPEQEKEKRTSKFRPWMVDKVRELRTELKRQDEIAKALGVSENCLYKWLRAGRDATDDRYIEFAEAYDEGLKMWCERMESEALKRLDKDKHWQSDAWLLERNFPKKYGRVQSRPYEDDEAVQLVTDVLVKIAETANNNNGKDESKSDD